MNHMDILILIFGIVSLSIILGILNAYKFIIKIENNRKYHQ